MHHTSGGSDLSLVMGDLNTEPDTLVLRLIKDNGGLTDAWDVRGNKDDVSVCIYWPEGRGWGCITP